MIPLSVVGLICEDIRPEKSGQETIVGVFPSNINVPHIPSIIPKLGVYIRVHVDFDADISSISGHMHMPDDTEIEIDEINREFIENAKKEAREKKSSFAGIILRISLAPVRITERGALTVYIKVDGEEQICANLVINETEGATSANV